MSNENWQCPHCGHHQALTGPRTFSGRESIRHHGSEFGDTALAIRSNVCSNENCKKMTLSVQLWARRDKEAHYDAYELKHPLMPAWELLPESSAKPQPEYILEPIRQDYLEACGIRELSSKASATISRRCLQGMIRDFCGISKKRLVEEINALRAAVNEGRAPAGVQPD